MSTDMLRRLTNCRLLLLLLLLLLLWKANIEIHCLFNYSNSPSRLVELSILGSLLGI